MSQRAFIDYELNGETYRYEGAWPEHQEAAVGDAMIELSTAGKQASCIDVLEAMGAKIIKTQGFGKNGEVDASHLRDLIVH